MHLVTREGKSWVDYTRREEIIRECIREETMRVIATGDKRRQVASGAVYNKRREGVIR